MRGGRGGGRGGLKRSPSPSRKKSGEITITTPKKDDEKGTIRRTTPSTTGPPNKQQQRQRVRTGPLGVDPTTGPPPKLQVVPPWPKVGEEEKTTKAHVAAVRASMDEDKLFQLWCDLVEQEPHRKDLIRTVERQLIRAQLHGMMGRHIATQANIQLDGWPSQISPLRDVKAVKKWGKERLDGSDRENAVWNSSRGDAEIDTIRDIEIWARGQTKEVLARTDKVLIQLVGTSGPCEACKRRIAMMANGIVNHWSRTTDLPKSQLPEIEVWSYYGNPPKPFKRRGYNDVFNGWPDDYPSPDLWFQRQDGGDQYVREHWMGTANPKSDTSDDEETTEEPDKSTEEPETTTEKPDTSTTKSSTSQDLVTTDR